MGHGGSVGALAPPLLAVVRGGVSVAGPWKVRPSILSAGSLYVVGRGLRSLGPVALSFPFSSFLTGRLRTEASESPASPVRKEPSAARGRVAVVVRAHSGTT